MNILFIALIHAIPIIVLAFLSRNKSSVNVTTAIMVVVALVSGGPKFFVFDLMSIGLAWFFSLSIIADTPASSINQHRSNKLSSGSNVKYDTSPSSTGDPDSSLTPNFSAPTRSRTGNHDRAKDVDSGSGNRFVEIPSSEVTRNQDHTKGVLMFDSFREASIFARDNPNSVIKRAKDGSNFTVIRKPTQ
jgi:hypothetical protein